MANIIQIPDNNGECPVPKHYCNRFRFFALDFQIGGSSLVQVVVEFDEQTNTAPNPDGEKFIFLGQTVEVDNSLINPTVTKMAWLANFDDLASEFLQWFNGNPNIAPPSTITDLTSGVAPNRVRRLTFGYVAPFLPSQIELDQIDFTQLTQPLTISPFSQLVAPIFKEGYKLYWQVFTRNFSGGVVPLCELSAIQPQVVNLGNQIIEIDLSDVKKLWNVVSSNLPSLITSVVNLSSSIQTEIFMRFGCMTPAVAPECGVVISPYSQTRDLKIFNSAPDYKDPRGMSRFCFDGTNLSEVESINYWLLNDEICVNSNAWFEYIGTFIAQQTAGTYQARFIFTMFNQTTSEQVQVLTTVDDVIQIPIGGDNINNLPSITIDMTQVLFFTLVIEIDSLSFIEYTKTYRFGICHDCCRANITFLTDAGGWGYMGFEKIDAIEIDDTFDEICRDIPCQNTPEARLNERGKIKLSQTTLERFTLLSPRLNVRRQGMLEKFKQLKKSRQVYIDEVVDGVTSRIPILFDAGATRIFQDEGFTRMVISGIYAHELPTLVNIP